MLFFIFMFSFFDGSFVNIVRMNISNYNTVECTHTFFCFFFGGGGWRGGGGGDHVT